MKDFFEFFHSMVHKLVIKANHFKIQYFHIFSSCSCFKILSISQYIQQFLLLTQIVYCL